AGTGRIGGYFRRRGTDAGAGRSGTRRAGGRGTNAARPSDLGVDQRADARAGDAGAAIARGRAPGAQLDARGRWRAHVASRRQTAGDILMDVLIGNLTENATRGTFGLKWRARTGRN